MAATSVLRAPSTLAAAAKVATVVWGEISPGVLGGSLTLGRAACALAAFGKVELSQAVNPCAFRFCDWLTPITLWQTFAAAVKVPRAAVELKRAGRC